MQRINDAVAPYTRFVRSERAKLEDARQELDGSRQEQGKLQTLIEEL